MRNQKAQLTLGDAPTVVLVVGLLFLVMATVAMIGDKYGSALLSDTSGSVTNESGASINATGYTLAKATSLGFASPVIIEAYNATGIRIIAINYTVSSAGVLRNATDVGIGWNDVNVSYSYTYTPPTVAYNATEDLQTEISNNTSIAGIVLTISLVGIVLTVLIGVFLGIRRTRI